MREWHDLLVDERRRVDPARRVEIAGGEGKKTYADLITGIVLHDTYHAGQIKMLERLAGSRH